MSGFRALHNGASGMSIGQRWIDTISHNLSNLSTDTRVGDEAFRARYLVLGENEGGGTGRGVELRRVVRAEGDAPLRHDPEHPLALRLDGDGDGLLDERWREVDDAGRWVAEHKSTGEAVTVEQGAGGEPLTGVVTRADGTTEVVGADELQFIARPDVPVEQMGLVQGPLVDLGGQMTDLMIAQRYFQANSRVVTAAKEAYESALRIGR